MPRAQNVLKRVVNSHCGGGGTEGGRVMESEIHSNSFISHYKYVHLSKKKLSLSHRIHSVPSSPKKKKEKKSHIFKGITKAEYSSSVPQIFTKARVRQVTFWGHQHHLRRHSLRGHSLRLIWWVLSVPFPFCSLLLTPPHPPNHGCLHWKINWH